MKRTPARKPLLLLASIAGALFCLLNAGGAELLCAAQGCRIYSGYGIFGLSFYSLGAAGFLLIILLTLLYPRAYTGLLLPLFLLGALLLDTLFLAYQFLFWPCTSCLAAALLLALAVLAGLNTFAAAARRLFFAIGGLWLVLFLFLSLAAAKEIALRPWPIFGPPDAPIQVFFSPDCPACRQAVRQLLENPETAAQAAFYPIAKNEADRRQIAAYAELTGLRQTDADTFLTLFTGDRQEGPAALPWRLRLRLLANKASLARFGAASVPLVIAPYLPQAPPPSFDLFAPPTPAPPLEGCSAFEEEPCD